MPITAIRRYSVENHIRRADALRTSWPSSGELLETYKQVLQFQGSLGDRLERSNFFRDDVSLGSQLNLSPLLPQFKDLLHLFAHSNQTDLAQTARQIETAGLPYWETLFRRYWAHGESADAEEFFARTFLQPVAEHLAHKAGVSGTNQGRPICPYCGHKPVCGVLRPEGDGAKRSLICSLCSTEWEYRRMVCPGCEQEDIKRLPVFTAESCAYIRIEACDACQTFIKTIDLTKDGRAIPVVDELASLPLTLWAEEKGYHKLQSNLLLM